MDGTGNRIPNYDHRRFTIQTICKTLGVGQKEYNPSISCVSYKAIMNGRSKGLKTFQPLPPRFITLLKQAKKEPTLYHTGPIHTILCTSHPPECSGPSSLKSTPFYPFIYFLVSSSIPLLLACKASLDSTLLILYLCPKHLHIYSSASSIKVINTTLFSGTVMPYIIKLSYIMCCSQGIHVQHIHPLPLFCTEVPRLIPIPNCHDYSFKHTHLCPNRN